MTSSQTAEADEATEKTGEVFEYTVPGSERVIHLKRPTESQVAVILRLQSMFEDSPVQGAQLYMDALGALMREEDEQWCLRALLRGSIPLEAFTNTARETLFHFYPELKKAAEEREKTSRQHGPATRRPSRRRA